MDIELTGWPARNKEFDARVEKAGLRACDGDQELFVDLVFVGGAVEDVDAEYEDRAAIVRRACKKIGDRWKSEPIVSLLFDGGLSSHYLDFSVHWCAKERVFVVLAADVLASGIVTVCGGDAWPARSGEQWRSKVGAIVERYIIENHMGLPSHIKLGSGIMSALDVAVAYAKSPSHEGEDAATFLEAFQRVLRPPSWAR